MTSVVNNNRCKLLVLDIDTNRLNSNDLRTFFTTYGPIEWIEIFPEFSSAIIYFVSYLIVDRLVSYRTCLIDQNQLRLRRFRFDKTNWNVDCHTLHVKFNITTGINIKLTESALFHCFEKYRHCIIKINVYPNNQALIFFLNYNCVDQLLLLPSNSFQINNESLILERMIKRFQWKQPPLQTRDPITHQLLNQIECLSKQLREKPGSSRREIERLEAELFILKNENALLKSNQNIERRRTVLGDISNRSSKRSRSKSNDEQRKRRW